MAAGRHARKFVALDIVHESAVGRFLFEAACAQMAMQAFAVIERLIELDRLVRCADELGVDTTQAPNFGFDTPV